MEIFPIIAVHVLIASYGCFAQESSTLPVRIPAVVINETTSGTCPAGSVTEAARASARAGITQVLNSVVIPSLNGSGPPCSCGGAGGWSRLAHLNMTDPNQQCPFGWTLITAPVRGCGRTNAGNFVCDSTFFSANGRSYSRVCGKVVAYQKGQPNAFHPAVTGSRPVEEAYASGLLLTHGAAGSRQHIWTFATAFFNQGNTRASYICPCTDSAVTWPFQIPSYVGNNYFCDSGNPGPGFDSTTVYSNDPLWDGEGCPSSNTCCEFNNPPWFCTSLPQPTSDDLEIRLCNVDTSSHEDQIVSLIDIYVK